MLRIGGNETFNEVRNSAGRSPSCRYELFLWLFAFWALGMILRKLKWNSRHNDGTSYPNNTTVYNNSSIS